MNLHSGKKNLTRDTLLEWELLLASMLALSMITLMIHAPTGKILCFIFSFLLISYYFTSGAAWLANSGMPYGWPILHVINFFIPGIVLLLVALGILWVRAFTVLAFGSVVFLLGTLLFNYILFRNSGNDPSGYKVDQIRITIMLTLLVIFLVSGMAG